MRRIEKAAADMIVPFDRFAEMMHVYRDGYRRRGLDCAIWGHVSDGNVHPNAIPRSYEDVVAGKDAVLEFGREVVRLGGSPLAEHGVGRSAIKQALLRHSTGPPRSPRCARSSRRSIRNGSWRRECCSEKPTGALT